MIITSVDASGNYVEGMSIGTEALSMTNLRGLVMTKGTFAHGQRLDVLSSLKTESRKN
jgi:hypothetical protein